MGFDLAVPRDGVQEGLFIGPKGLAQRTGCLAQWPGWKTWWGGLAESPKHVGNLEDSRASRGPKGGLGGGRERPC